MKFAVSETYLSIIKKAVNYRYITLEEFQKLAVAVHAKLLGCVPRSKSDTFYLYGSFNSFFKNKDIVTWDKLIKVYMKTDILKIFCIGELEYLAVENALRQLRGKLVKKFGYFYLHYKTPCSKMRSYCNDLKRMSTLKVHIKACLSRQEAQVLCLLPLSCAECRLS